jgi:hypothetical protein
MRNLIVYKDDCFEVHKKAVNSKDEGDIKTKLISLNPIVEQEYKIYAKNFFKNTLNAIISNATLLSSKDVLKGLYYYQSKTVRDVRENIRKLQFNTISATCQNCTINSTNTLDHILPKDIFPAFVVNPQNLFPCCSECNSYKSKIIEKDDKRFLNLYLDTLPDVQYLFVNISLDKDNNYDFKYYLKNEGNKIPTKLFKIIEFHYEKLYLFDRFKFHSTEYVSEFENQISTLKSVLTITQIKSILYEDIRENKKAYGANHWKYILKDALLNSDIFMKKFI